jgi:hypothetical protein
MDLNIFILFLIPKRPFVHTMNKPVLGSIT